MSSGDQLSVEELLRRLEETERDKQRLELQNRQLERRAETAEAENRTLKCDFVTGLPMRHTFETDIVEQLKKLLTRTEAQAYLQAEKFSDLLYPPDHGTDNMNMMLGYADIWLLRYWNNRYKHEMGDRVLKGFASAALAKEVPWFKVYRAGERGDEFMALAHGRQQTIAEHFTGIKRELNQLSVPSDALFTPDVDIGFCTIYEALWAYARIITESQMIKPGGRDELTRIRNLIIKIAEIRGRVQKCRARLLLLAESMRESLARYHQVCEHLYGGTHLDETDTLTIVAAQTGNTSPQSVEAQVLMIAARPDLEDLAQARKRYESLRGKDGTDSLILLVQIQAALYMKPFNRR